MGAGLGGLAVGAFAAATLGAEKGGGKGKRRVRAARAWRAGEEPGMGHALGFISGFAGGGDSRFQYGDDRLLIDQAIKNGCRGHSGYSAYFLRRLVMGLLRSV